MGSLVTFSSESASRVRGAVGPSAGACDPHLSSRLLNRQIKCAMILLQQEITESVLNSLEKSMRSKTRGAWGPSFVAILVLCLCMEDVQIAADTFVVCDIIKMKEREGMSPYNRNHSHSICSALDEYPFRQCVKLFHDI